MCVCIDLRPLFYQNGAGSGADESANFSRAWAKWWHNCYYSGWIIYICNNFDIAIISQIESAFFIIWQLQFLNCFTFKIISQSLLCEMWVWVHYSVQFVSLIFVIQFKWFSESTSKLWFSYLFTSLHEMFIYWSFIYKAFNTWKKNAILLFLFVLKSITV